MVRTKYFVAMVAAILTVLATGCIVSFEPETAVNPVGTEHTVTVTLRDEEELDEETLCEIFEGVIEIILEDDPQAEVPLDPCLQDTLSTADIEMVHFEVTSGPNIGTNSIDDGECEPSCTTLNEETSWTYRSNGVLGTDTILVCVNFLELLPGFPGSGDPSTTALTPEEFEEMVLDVINDALNSDYESLDDLFCREATKTWQEPQRPNIGAGLSGLFQGQPTALPTAQAPVAVAPSTTIRPPSTGDAGLK